MALFRKFFYKKPPEGLLEITERVYVFDYCFTTDVMEEDEYKVYIGGIIGQLLDHFPDASFMVFNMREGQHQSQISNILCDYDMTVMDYPRQYEGCPLLTMEMIHHFLRSGENWLQLGQQNVVLMHCERGGWPVLAFMVAALLIYRKMFTGEQKTLDMIYKQAPRELLQLMSPLNPIPSQLRYLQYISRRNVGSEWPPLDRALTLDCVIIRVIPNMDGEGGCRPIFRIYGQDPFIPADRTPKVLFSTPKKSKLVRHYKQADCELVKIDIHCHVQGDVVLECISVDSDLEREQMMFRVMFNTAFIRSNILMLNRDEIDMLWNAKDHFPKNFRVEILFSDMEASSSVISIDLPRIEEKEGLPVEAFAKVKEIFSHVDWLESKTEVANALQQITASNILLEKLDGGISPKTSSLLKKSFSGTSIFDLKTQNDTKSLTSAVPGKLSSSSPESSGDAPMEKIEPLESKALSENNDTRAIFGQGKQPESFGLSTDLDSTKKETESLESTGDAPMEKKKEPLESKASPESNIKTLAPMGQEKQPIPSSGRSTDSNSTEVQNESLESKALVENDSKFPTSMAQGKQSIPLTEPSMHTNLLKQKVGQLESKEKNIKSLESKSLLDYDTKCPPSVAQGEQSIPLTQPSMDANSMKKKIGQSESMVLSENDIKSLTSTVQRKQSSPLLAPSIDANSIKKPIEPQELQVALQLPTQSKIISPRVHQAVRSAPSSYSNSFLGSPKAISRYHSAPSALGITTVLQDHKPMDIKEEVTHSVTKSPSPSTLPPSDSKVPKSMEPSSTSVPPASSPASLPSMPLKSSVDAPAVVEKTSGTLAPAPAPHPPAPSQFEPTSKLVQSVVTQHPENTMHDKGQKSLVTPPPPLSSPSSAMNSSSLSHPSSSSLPETSLSTVKDSFKGPPPPPPPPPPPSTGQTSSSSIPSPPPPPPLSAFPSSASRPPTLSVPPPPPPPASPFSMNKSTAMPGPPPPPPPPSHASTTPGSTPAPLVPPPPPPGHSGITPGSTPTPSMPPPPPPPASPLSMSKSAAMSGPPPPPPPPGNSSTIPGSTPTPSVPPPPPPPLASPSGNSLSKNSANVPPVPPPPSPAGNGLSKPGTASPQSHAGVGNGNVPPVPGPPSGGPLGAKGRGLLRANPKSQTKRSNLKPYHWLKLTRAMQGSLWAETQKLDEYSRAPEFDMSELESLFSAVAPKSDHEKGGKSNRRAAGQKADRVQLIELRRAYNCEIMLTKVKIPLSDLMGAVLALDDSVLHADQVENLIKFCPTKEEIELLKGYNGDKENLGKCEQFFLELMKVPRVESKLRVFSFKMQFYSQVSELRRDLNIVNSASEEIRDSVKLKRIMQTILSLGNALNHGTARGSAVGFRLDSLLKLTDTRARNNKMTLMHYLCKVLAEKLPELLDFHKDLASLEAATKIQLKFLAEEMQAISKGLEKVIQELTASENDGPVSENFCQILKEFLSDAEAEVRSLAQLYANVGRNADALALYFGEDPARCPFEQVVSTLLNFSKMFVKAHDENCKQLEYEKKKAEKEAEKEKLKLAATKEPEHMIRTTIKSGSK